MNCCRFIVFTFCVFKLFGLLLSRRFLACGSREIFSMCLIVMYFIQNLAASRGGPFAGLSWSGELAGSIAIFFIFTSAVCPYVSEVRGYFWRAAVGNGAGWQKACRCLSACQRRFRRYLSSRNFNKYYLSTGGWPVYRGIWLEFDGSNGAVSCFRMIGRASGNAERSTRKDVPRDANRQGGLV